MHEVVEARSEVLSSALGRWDPFAAALLEPVGVAVHLQDVHMVGEPIKQGTSRQRSGDSQP